MPLYLHFIYSLISTIGFSIVFNVPKKSLFYAGITGAIGWSTYVFINDITFSASFSNFIASIIVGILGEIFARIDKKPVTVFVIPGIVPLVPGYGMYLTMTNLINNHFEKAAIVGTDTLFKAGAIAIGIILVSSIAKIIKKIKIKKNKTFA